MASLDPLLFVIICVLGSLLIVYVYLNEILRP